MANQLSVVSPDGQWKADLKAWKNYAFVYASIGCEVTVYHNQQTKDVWGNTAAGWVKHEATINIQNLYKDGVGRQIGAENRTFRASSSAELKKFAFGIITITISDAPNVGDPSLNAPLITPIAIDSVEGHISVFPDGVEPLTGVVSAGSYVIDNSIWG